MRRDLCLASGSTLFPATTVEKKEQKPNSESTAVVSSVSTFQQRPAAPEVKYWKKGDLCF